MNKYDYIIIGGGPTGLTLGYILSKNNYKILLIEKESILGGCWKSDYVQNKYFTEHSPRVLSNGIIYNLFNNMNYKYKDRIIDTYGNKYLTTLKIFGFILREFTFFDKLKLLLKVIQSIFSKGDNMTVCEWAEKNNISNRGKKGLEVLSIIIANSPNKLLVSELFGSISENNNFLFEFKQFKDNMEWINIIENKIKEYGGNIMKNVEINKLNYSNKNITSINFNNNIFTADNYILSLPPIALNKILSNSNLKNNFIEDMDKWVEDSYYISFGFQIHFKYKPYDILDKGWCYTCMNDYNLIIIPTSKYVEEYTKDKDIVEVWSCTIVDTSVFIKHIGKTVDEMTKEEIINDIIKILNLNNNSNNEQFIITYSDGLHNKNGRWYSKDSAFSVGKSGTLNTKGNINNLYTVGPHNMRGITTINKAIHSAIYFLKNKNIDTFRIDKKSINLFYLIFLIFILIIIIWNIIK